MRTKAYVRPSSISAISQEWCGEKRIDQITEYLESTQAR